MLGLFHCGTLCTPNGFGQFHPFLDGGLGEERTLFDFFEYTRTLVLFLETPYGAIDGFVFTDDNANQEIHLLRGLTMVVI